MTQPTDALRVNLHQLLKAMIENHAINTKSTRAATILKDWDKYAPKFIKVLPKDYKRMLEKIKEEIEEVKGATNESELASELGDLLFALVNLARWKKVDAESALRGTNMKFKKRFAYVELGAKKQERRLSALSLEEMDALWNEAKKQGI